MNHKCMFALLWKATMDIGVESVNRKKIWVSDAKAALGRGLILTAKCLYKSAIKILPKDEDLWIALAQLEMNYESLAALDEVLLKVRIKQLMKTS